MNFMYTGAEFEGNFFFNLRSENTVINLLAGSTLKFADSGFPEFWNSIPQNLTVLKV